jgi:hypothetical protein
MTDVRPAPPLPSGDPRGRAAPPPRLSALFPAPPHRPAARWRLALGAAALVVGSVTSLSRTGGVGPLDSTWIEDAYPFLGQAIVYPWYRTIVTPLNGYLNVGPRVVAEFAALFGLGWAPAVMSICAAALIAACAMVAYVGSRAYLPSPWYRLLVAVPVVVVPLGQTQMQNDMATLQFPALYAMFWLLLWRPAGRVGALFAAAFAADITLSSILPVVFLPLAVARLVAVRDRATRAVVGAYAGGLAVQFGAEATGLASRAGIGTPRWDPVWAGWEYLRTLVPGAVFGTRWTVADPHRPTASPALTLAAWLVVAGIVAVAAFGVTRPAWRLAALALAHSVVLWSVEVMAMGSLQPRYFVPPALLLYAAFAALLRPHSTDPAKRFRFDSVGPAVAWAMLLAVVCVAGLRVHNLRGEGPAWHDVLATATRYCGVDPARRSYPFRAQWWGINIPCRLVR